MATTKPLTVEDFRRAQVSTGTPCQLSQFLEAHPADTKAVWEAIRTPKVSCESIARVLRGRGATVSGESIRRHRSKSCAWCAS